MRKFQDYLEISQSKYRFVIIKNQNEMDQFKKWAHSVNKNMDNIPEELPIYLSFGGAMIGWTDHADRAAEYLPFEEFKKEVGL